MSISPARMQVVISSAENPATSRSASRKVSASSASDSRYARIVSDENTGSDAVTEANASVVTAAGPHRLQFARWAGQHDDRGQAIGTSDGDPRRGAGGRNVPGILGTYACLRTPAAAASGSGPSIPRQRSRMSVMCDSRSGHAATRARRTRRRSGRSGRRRSVRSPPVVTIRSTPSSTRNRSCAVRSSGRSPQTVMCATSTPRPQQLFGHPRPVAVGDPAGQHFGSGDDDPLRVYSPIRPYRVGEYTPINQALSQFRTAWKARGLAMLMPMAPPITAPTPATQRQPMMVAQLRTSR